MNTLDKIAQLCGTDKCSEVHDYCVKYEKYLPFERYEKLNILEIGVFNGESLRMWKEYYYRSNVLGIDINPDCKKHEQSRISVEIGSQTDVNFLLEISQKHGPFDMIVDDGSHMNSDVILSFENLWKHVKSGGVYIVEDTCTSYWEIYGGGHKNPNSTIEYFKNIIDDINFRGVESTLPIKNARKDEFLKEPYSKVNPTAVTDIESMNFMNSMIIINKK